MEGCGSGSALGMPNPGDRSAELLDLPGGLGGRHAKSDWWERSW